MSLPSLFAFSQTNKNYNSVITSIVERRMAKNLITFNTTSQVDEMDNDVLETKDSITIQKSQFALTVLKKVGNFITNLEIRQCCNREYDDIQLIKKSIAQYCSDTLKQLQIINEHENATLHSNFFSEFTKPLKNVENVSLRGQFGVLENSNLKFNDIFPGMRRLSLKSLDVLDMSWVNQTFHNLQDLYAEVWSFDNQNRLTEEAQGSLLINNPQIGSLVLKNARLKLLGMLSDRMPNLENLTLTSYTEFSFHSIDHQIHFDNVKYLKMQLGFRSVPKNLFLKNIEVFETDAFPNDCSRWIEFVDKHKHLRVLRFAYPIKTGHIKQLAAIKPNLVEILLKMDENADFDSIARLIESSPKLEKVILDLPWRNPEPLAKFLENRFKCNWIFSRIRYFSASLERK